MQLCETDLVLAFFGMCTKNNNDEAYNNDNHEAILELNMSSYFIPFNILKGLLNTEIYSLFHIIIFWKI